MAIPSRQIGGSTRTNLLWQISKQLEQLICIRSGGCGSTTTTTSSSSTTTTSTTIIEPTTTTTTSYPISIECIVYLAANGNIYIYDPLTNLSVEILSDESPYFQVANTDTKLWSIQGGGYINEFDITFSPGPSLTYNRLINTGSVFASGTFAIDNTTLIVCDSITPGIYELDITTTTSINTFKGNIEAGYLVNDLLLTTSGKLIMVAVDIATNTITKVYQYDYATWTLETSLDLTSQLPTGSKGVGLAQYNGDIYIFTRITYCEINTTPSGVYILDPLTNNITLVNSTGLSCPSGASSWLPCNTTSLTNLQCNNIAFANNSYSLWVTDGSPTNFVRFDPATDIPQSKSIATTYNKLFALVNVNNYLQPVRKIYEYDMSYSPNTLTFVREIDYPVGVDSLGNGACALNDTMLIVPIPQCTPDYAVCVDPTPIVRLDISGSVAVIDSIITYLPMFNATNTLGVPTGNIYSNRIIGDLIYTTDNKIITLDQNSTWPLVSYIHQYDAITGDLELELVIDTPLSPTIPILNWGVGLFIRNSNLYIINNSNPNTGDLSTSYICQVDLTSPYNITVLGEITPDIKLFSDASNAPGCSNVSFTPCTTCNLPDVIIGSQTWTACNLNITNYQIGTPTLSLCGTSCGTTLDGNVLEVTYADPNGGASLVQVGSTNSYTQITITGPGGGDGSAIALCLDDVTPPLDCTSCNLIALPNATVGGIGSVTYGDLIINTTYSGPTLNNTNDFITCTGKTTPINCLILGNNVGDFTYTLNFSEPVNNIKLLFAGGGAAPGSPYIEYYTFTTNDGDPIPQVQDPTEWAALTTGAWCYYENDLLNGCIYGKLYNWYAVNDPRGLAPAGYHVPTVAEYNTLQIELGGITSGGPLKEAGLTHWLTPNTGATNTSGWTGLPGGQRNYDSTFQYIQEGAAFWTSSSVDPLNSTALQLYYTNDNFVEFPSLQTVGFSIRLIKDPTITTTTTTLAPTGFNTIYTHFEAL